MKRKENITEIIEKLKKSRTHNAYKPHVFQLHKEEDKRILLEFIEKGYVQEALDATIEQQRELRVIENPKILEGGKEYIETQGLPTERGLWVYYPWKATLVHIVPKKEFQKIKTSRNHNLLTLEEQKKLESATVGIAGLNVGNPAALCLALKTGHIHMKFADNDVLESSNLNRFRAGLPDLLINKAVLSARQAYEINPFLNIDVFSEGITAQNLQHFLLKPKINLLIEEMDHLPLKIAMREVARSNGIPVIMVTGNGPNLILDIERYDTEPELALLSGHLKQKIIDAIKDPKSKDFPLSKKVFLARDFIGTKLLTARLKESFLEVGKKLAGIPQLAEASFLRGAVLGYVSQQIILGERVSSGRYQVRLDTLFKGRK